MAAIPRDARRRKAAVGPGDVSEPKAGGGGATLPRRYRIDVLTYVNPCTM